MEEESRQSTSKSRFLTKKRHTSAAVYTAKRRKHASSSSDDDNIYNSEYSFSFCGHAQVSNWTLQGAEMYGLCYEAKSTDISKFYGLFTKRKSRLKYPLEESRKRVVDSLTSQAGKVDRPGVTVREGDRWRTWEKYCSVLEKCQKSLESIDTSLNRPQKNSKLVV
jgi:hypothetical protein